MFPEIDWGLIASGMPTPALQGVPDFQQRFDAARPQGVAPNPMESPISPEVLARNAAARGIPPPPVDLTPQAPAAPTGHEEPTRLYGSTFGPEGGSDVGAALTGKTVQAPMDIRPPIQQQQQDAPTDVSAQKKDGKLDKFAEGLKGVKAPANPELQRVSTPAAPRPTNSIRGGELMALLQLLGGPSGAAPQLPTTLGGALRRG